MDTPGTRKNTTKMQTGMFTSNIQKNENIKNSLSAAPKITTEIEKVPVREVIFFIIYAVVFFLILFGQLPVVSTSWMNEDISQRFYNRIRINGKYKALSGSRPSIYDVNSVDDVITFLTNAINPSRSLNDSILVNGTNNTDFKYYSQFTSWRILQQRAARADPQNNLSTFRWDPSGKLSKENFGRANDFAYSEKDGGFPIFMDIAYNETPSTAVTRMMGYLQSGYLDSFTMQLMLDAGFYLNTEGLICYTSAIFEFVATGVVLKPTTTFGCAKYNLYSSSVDKARAVLEIIFCALTLYYLITEIRKVISLIRTEKRKAQLRAKANEKSQTHPKNSDNIKISRSKNCANAALNFVASHLRSMVTGLVKYLQNVWNALDAASVVLSIISIIAWAIYIGRDSMRKQMGLLEIQNYKYVINNDEDLANLRALNYLFREVILYIELYYRCTALNGVLIMIKAIKFASNYIHKVEEILLMMIRVASNILSFLVLLAVVLVGFAFFLYFFYGDRIEFFSSFPNSFFYTGLNTIKNFDQLSFMTSKSYGTALMYFLIFCIVVNFILINMFLIYVVTAYRKYAAEQSIKVKQEKEDAFKKADSASPFSLTLLYLYEKHILKIIRIFKYSKYKELKDHEDLIKKEIEREISTSDASVYNQTIYETLAKDHAVKLHSNDVAKEKIRRKKIQSWIRIFWGTIGTLLILILYIYITIQRHQTTEANLIAENLNTQMKEIVVSAEYPSIDGTTLLKTRSIAQLKTWLRNVMPSKALNKTYTTGAAGGTKIPFNGFAFGDYNLLPTPEITYEIRRKNPLYQESDTLDKLTLIRLPSPWDWDAPANPPDEFQGAIANSSGGASWTYNESLNCYHVTLSTEYYEDQIGPVLDSGLIDASLNTLTLEVPLYNFLSRVPVYFWLQFSVNEVGSLQYSIKTRALKTLAIGAKADAGDIVLYIVQIAVGLGFIFYIRQLFLRIKNKREVYDFWYQVYIHPLPAVYKRKRFLLQPEFLRRADFVFSIGEIISILYSVCILLSVCLSIYYLVVDINTRNMFNEVLFALRADTSDALSHNTDDILSALQEGNKINEIVRYVDSITIIIITLKLIYYFAFNSNFLIITETLKKAFGTAPYMACCLLIVLLAFSYLLFLIAGPINESFTYLAESWRTLMQSIFGFPSTSVELLKNYKDSFLTVFFFYPYVIVTRYLIYNIFVGIVYNAYAQTKREVNSGDKFEWCGLREFVTLSIEMFRKKTGGGDSTHAIELTEDFRITANPNRVIPLYFSVFS